MSPRSFDHEDDLRDEEPAETPPAFTPAEARAAAEERAAIIVDAVGRGPALPCSAPRVVFVAHRWGWECDHEGPGCSRLLGRSDFPWHSTEADSARRLDAADFAALAKRPPVRGAAHRVMYAGRRNVEIAPMRELVIETERGSEGDLAAALATLADAPRWVGAEERLEKVRELVRSAAGLRRGTLLEALGVEP